MKKLFTSLVALVALFSISSCLQEERSPEDILIPSPAQVDCSESAFSLTSKVPSGSENLVYECGFLVGKDKLLGDGLKVEGALTANTFSADFPLREYGTTYYMCAYVTNGHGSEIRSDLRSFELEALEEYVEFGQISMLSYDPLSRQALITVDTDIWAGVNVTEAGVCYGTEPSSLTVEGDHKSGTHKYETRAEGGVIEILLDGFEDATQYYLRPYLKDGGYLTYGEVVPFYIPSVAKVSTFDAEDITPSGAKFSGEVTDECGSPVTERGFAWIEGDGTPTVESDHVVSGSGLGTMTATIEGLNPNRKYTFRAYAINASGTSYGDPKTFTTLVALPVLSTSTITDITSKSATFNGVLADDGGESISEVGFYYSTSKEVDPSTAEKVSIEYSTYQKSARELSENTLLSAMQSAQKAASDEGESFSIDVFNLAIKTRYYVKSYAVNSAGTAYGAVVNFETAGEIATIRTVGSSEVTTGSAVLSGNVTSDNGEKITERGFVWMQGTGTPTTDSDRLKVTGTVGEYTATLTGLEPNKKYSFRAYAINAEGTAYGDVMSFTTKVDVPVVSTPIISAVTSISARFSATVKSHGGETVSEVGFYYGTDADVDLETASKISLPYSEDTFSADISDLAVNTKYYVKSYTKNSAGTVYSGVETFSTDSSSPSVKTSGIADITPDSALLSGSVLNDNGARITERGFVWIQGEGVPTTDSHRLSVSGTIGDYTATLSGLDPNKKYSFRAYAINSKGTSYGETMTFATVAGLPVLSSVDVSAITSTSATFASTVTDHGGETVSEVGFYYSTDETVDPATSVKITQKYAKDAFTSQIADLAIFTKYYVKAYATNSAGTAYSDVVDFKTLASTPVVNTVGSSDITFNSATLSGKVLTDNGAAITERGFVWIKGEGTPTTSSNKVKVNGTTGDYTASLSDLEPNVTYSYCAYAVNELGTSYGAVMKFETIKGLPTLGPVNVSNVTSTAASFSSSVTGHGGETVSEIGFYYSTDAAVDPSSSVKVNLTYSSDSFSSSVSGLAVNTKYYVKSYARNSVGTVYSGVISFTTLADVPVVNTVGSSDVTSSSAVLSGKVVTDNGATITERGFVWVQGEGTPTTSSLKLTTTGTTGDFYATIKDLAPNQKYSFRAYAINSKGTAYGEIMTFSTVVGLPVLSTVDVADITATSAIVTADVKDKGGESIAEVGFYYSTEETVDIESSVKVKKNYTGNAFSASLDELQIFADYYVKAYAVNSAGVAYSDVVSFKTLASIPVVNTVGASEITPTSAVLSGTVATDNGAAITERGFVWLKGSDAPTTSSNKVKVDGTTGDFTTALIDLDPNQKYSFRAYAINSKGTSYGDVMTFTTVAGLPTLSAMKVSDITTTSATFTCAVTGHSGDIVSEVGFYIGKEESVDIETALKISEAYTSELFILTATNLEVGTEYYVKAYTKNSVGESYSAIVPFKTVSTAPSVTTVGSSEITDSSALLSGEVTDDNGEDITERGFVWLKGTGTPTTSNSKLRSDGTTGEYLATLSDLEPNQTYSYRSYAVNAKGTAYGETMTFRTKVALPEVVFVSCSDVTSSSAIVSGKVTSHGGETVSEVGFLYGTTSNLDSTTSLKVTTSYTGDSFSLTLTSLTRATEHYVQPFAKNSAGTAYGEVTSFTTLPELPVVTTNAITDITDNSAVCGGVIVDDGGSDIIAKGVVWSRSQNPTVEDSFKTEDGNGVDSFTSYLADLTPGRTYYVRAYATNLLGTSYGDQHEFRTTGESPFEVMEASNCFIISESGTYVFESVKGNSYESVGSVFSAEVLWESYGTSETPVVGSLVSSVSAQGDMIVFKVPEPYREGNAVIAAKDEAGTILWSWHIWLTDEPEGHVYNNNAGTMMDRNLGATSSTPGDVGALGLLYQWGRKDPFLGSSSISSDVEARSTITWPSYVTSNSSNGTIEYAISHPTTFVEGGSSSSFYDWHYSSRNNMLWQSEKTIYDPCPVGWRVPDGGSNGVWETAGFADTSYDSSNEGINFSISSPSTTWYPASGCRSYNDGALGGVGYEGLYWSVTPDGSLAYFLYFDFYINCSSVDPMGNSTRAYGFPVRCLQE